MAITFVARAQGSTNSSSATVTVTYPTGTQAGDCVVLALQQNGSAPTSETGWTAIGQAPANLGLFYQIYTSGASWTSANSYSFPKAVMRTYRGVAKTDAFNGAQNLNTLTGTIPALAATAAANEWYVGFWFNGDTSVLPAPPGDLVNTNNNDTQWGSCEGDKAITTAGTVPGAESATKTGTQVAWQEAAVTLIPLLGGFRHVYLPQSRHHHQFANPKHVRIYHPRPAQYETLLVPVRVRPRPQIYPKKWKLPLGWRSRDKFKGRLWHWPQEFMTLLVPVKPRPIPFRTKAHWIWATDARQNVLKHLKRPASFFIAAALPKFRTRAHWKWATGWRERLKFPVKYRPAEFMTLLVPMKPRPVPFRTRIHWKLPWPLDAKWNPLHRPRASAFSTGALNIEVPKRYRARWRPRALLDRIRLPHRLSGATLFSGIVRHYRVRRAMSRAQRHPLARRLGTQAQAVTVTGGVRLRHQVRYALRVARRAQSYQRRRASAELLLTGIRHRTKLHSNNSISNAGSAVIVAAAAFIRNNPLIKSLGKMMNRL